MRIIRRAGRAAVAVAVTFCFCALARAQGVLDQVPDGALVVVKINRLDQTNKKAAAWAEAMGIQQLHPDAADPLGAVERQLNLQGVDHSGDVAFVYVDPARSGAPQDKSILILVPTKDYKKFVGSLPNSKAGQGNLTTFRAENEGEESQGYAAQWGNYAALSPAQALVSKKPAAGGLKLTGLAAREMQQKDAVFYANIPALKDRLLPELRKAREQMRKEMQNAQKKAGGNASSGTDTTEDATKAGERPANRSGNRRGPGASAAPSLGRSLVTMLLQQRQRQQPPARRPAPPPPPPAENDADAKDKNAGQDDGPASPEAMMAQYFPALGAMMDQYFAGAEQFLNDATAATFSLNLTDEGLNTTAAAEFIPGSYLGNVAKGIKNNNRSLLAGLPGGRQYFAFGGMLITPEVMSKVFTDAADPVLKQLAGAGQGGQTVTSMVNAWKTAFDNTKTTTVGYVAPAKEAIGQDSLIQAVTISTGNARQIAQSQKTIVKGMSGLFQNLPKQAANGGKAPKMDMQYKDAARTVNGVKLDEFKMNIQMDADNDPQAAQAQRMMQMMYGQNGMTAVMGPVNDTTFLAVQGGSEKLIADAVNAAKNPQDQLGGTAPVKAASAQLPRDRFFVFYVALDQIITTGGQYAQNMGLPVNLQLPKNLPPIGMTMSSESNGMRFDTHVPTTTVQSIVAAGMQAYMNMQGGGQGAKGQPDGL